MLKILLLLLMGMTVDGATFCESYHQVSFNNSLNVYRLHFLFLFIVTVIV